MTPARTLVIGIGNRYRGDDGFGCIVAAELACRTLPGRSLPGRTLPGRSLPGVSCIEHDGEPAALMDCWQGAERVVLIDAVSSGAKPGTIFRFNLAQHALPEAFKVFSTHAFGVPQAIELARVLQKLPPQIAFIGVEGACFEAGEELSPALVQAVDAVVAEILNLLESQENNP